MTPSRTSGYRSVAHAQNGYRTYWAMVIGGKGKAKRPYAGEQRDTAKLICPCGALEGREPT